MGSTSVFSKTSRPQRGRLKGSFKNVVCHAGIGPDQLALYGPELEEKLKEYGSRIASGSIMAETLPRFENHVRINPHVKDTWGIPVLHTRQRMARMSAVFTTTRKIPAPNSSKRPVSRSSERILRTVSRARASMSLVHAVWAMIQKRACSTNGTKATTLRTCLWLMEAAS